MSDLTQTKHSIVRMSQRGIRLDDLELAERIGTEVEGGYFVRRKDFQAYERETKRRLDQARRLVGQRVVKKGDVVITAYHASRADERRLLRRGCNGA